MKELQFIGIGGAYALKLGGNCAFVKDGSTLFLIDCCEGAAGKLCACRAFDGVEKIVVAITHTHADHVSGLGTLIWYCKFMLGIGVELLQPSNTFKDTLQQILTLQGVSEEYYCFVSPKSVLLDRYEVVFRPTCHTHKLECYGIAFCGKEGIVYYTGDTCDIDYVKALTQSEEVKRVYCEVCSKAYGVHLAYEDLKELDRSKLVLMHFETEELYSMAQQDGFRTARLCVK